MPNVYEFVPKSEYAPVKQKICSCLSRAVEILKEKEIYVTYSFVGSSNRNGEAFITRIKGGNKGFDFDINLYVECPSKNKFWKADYLRQEIYQAIDECFSRIGYDHPEDRTSVIRIKVKDRDNSRIIHSVDFAIFQDFYNNNEIIQKYSRKISNGQYTWELRGGKNSEADDKLEWLQENIGDDGDDNFDYSYGEGLTLSDNLKNEYLKLKNNNEDENKASFQLYFEAIANIFNSWQQYIENNPCDDDEDLYD